MISFEVYPVRSYTLTPEFFPVFITFLEDFYWLWNLRKYPRHRLFHVSYRPKMGSFYDLLADPANFVPPNICFEGFFKKN